MKYLFPGVEICRGETAEFQFRLQLPDALEGLLEVTNLDRNMEPVENMSNRLSRRSDHGAFEC